MENELHFWQRPEDYRSFFEGGVTDDAIERAFRYTKIRGYAQIQQSIEDSYYRGMPRFYMNHFKIS